MNKTIELAKLISKVSYDLDMLLSRKLKDENLAVTEFKTLMALLENGDTPIQEIAKEVLLTSGSMTYIADKLVDKGFVEKIQLPEDNRVFKLSLTKNGRKKIKGVSLFSDEIIEEYFGNYKEKDKDKIIKILNKTK